MSNELTTNRPEYSLVLVEFEDFFKPLTYYNDKFKLKKGDYVYVEGKLEGKQGKVIDIKHTFKVNLSDYKKVIAVADTDICGELYHAGKYAFAFEDDIINYRVVRGWFNNPQNIQHTALAWGIDEFDFADVKSWPFDEKTAYRGKDCYEAENVVYLSINDEKKVSAIIRGSDTYHEVEFYYVGGKISSLVCDCYRFENCRHQYAALLQLKQFLQTVTVKFAEQYEKSGCFAAISKACLYKYAIEGKDKGKISL